VQVVTAIAKPVFTVLLHTLVTYCVLFGDEQAVQLEAPALLKRDALQGKQVELVVALVAELLVPAVHA